MNKKKIILALVFFCVSIIAFAQPFVDPANANSQIFNTTYKDSLHSKSKTIDDNLSIFFPKKFKNENVLLLRLSGELLESSIEKSYYDLYAFSIPFGFQFTSKNKKWKPLFLFIPKISSDLKDNLSKDFQYGGTGLITYAVNDSFKLKVGLFYNRECFGNFFVPLVGIDWRASERWSVYGILPNNMRVEFKCSKNFYLGLGFKNYKRSYRLSQSFNNDFVLVKETQLKFFIDFYTKQKIVLCGDISYMLQYDFAEYENDNPKILGMYNPIYSPINNGFVYTFGIAYRIRN